MDIPQPQEDEDGGSSCPEDGEFFYARPDATEMEEAISKLIGGLESQEHSCFDSLHTLQEQCTYLYSDIYVCTSYIICMLMFIPVTLCMYMGIPSTYM